MPTSFTFEDAVSTPQPQQTTGSGSFSFDDALNDQVKSIAQNTKDYPDLALAGELNRRNPSTGLDPYIAYLANEYRNSNNISSGAGVGEKVIDAVEGVGKTLAGEPLSLYYGSKQLTERAMGDEDAANKDATLSMLGGQNAENNVSKGLNSAEDWISNKVLGNWSAQVPAQPAQQIYAPEKVDPDSAVDLVNLLSNAAGAGLSDQGRQRFGIAKPKLLATLPAQPGTTQKLSNYFPEDGFTKFQQQMHQAGKDYDLSQGRVLDEGPLANLVQNVNGISNGSLNGASPSDLFMSPEEMSEKGMPFNSSDLFAAQAMGASADPSNLAWELAPEVPGVAKGLQLLGRGGEAVAGLASKASGLPGPAKVLLGGAGAGAAGLLSWNALSRIIQDPNQSFNYVLPAAGLGLVLAGLKYGSPLVRQAGEMAEGAIPPVNTNPVKLGLMKALPAAAGGAVIGATPGALQGSPSDALAGSVGGGLFGAIGSDPSDIRPIQQSSEAQAMTDYGARRFSDNPEGYAAQDKIVSQWPQDARDQFYRMRAQLQTNNPTDMLAVDGPTFSKAIDANNAAGSDQNRGFYASTDKFTQSPDGKTIYINADAFRPDVAKQLDPIRNRLAEINSLLHGNGTSVTDDVSDMDEDDLGEINNLLQEKQGLLNRANDLISNGNYDPNDTAGHEMAHGLLDYLRSAGKTADTVNLFNTIKSAMGPDFENAVQGYKDALKQGVTDPKKLEAIDNLSTDQLAEEAAAENARKITNNEDVSNFALPQPLREKLSAVAGGWLRKIGVLPKTEGPLGYGFNEIPDAQNAIRGMMYQQGAEAKANRDAFMQGLPKQIEDLDAQIRSAESVANPSQDQVDARNNMVSQRDQLIKKLIKYRSSFPKKTPSTTANGPDLSGSDKKTTPPDDDDNDNPPPPPPPGGGGSGVLAYPTHGVTPEMRDAFVDSYVGQVRPMGKNKETIKGSLQKIDEGEKLIDSYIAALQKEGRQESPDSLFGNAMQFGITGQIPKSVPYASEQPADLSKPADNGKGPAAPGTATPGAAPSDNTASVPVMITKAMEQQLRGLGYEDADINKMRPAEAHQIIQSGTQKAEATGKADLSQQGEEQKAPTRQTPDLAADDFELVGERVDKNGNKTVSGRKFDFNNPDHQKILSGSGLTEAQIAQIKQIQESEGPIHITYDSATPVRGEQTNAQRRESQQESPVEDRLSGKSASTLEDKSLVNPYFVVSKYGKILIKGYSPDKMLGNSIKAIDMLQQAVGAPYESVNDPEFTQDFNDYVANQRHGYTGQGDRPLTETEGVPVQLDPNYTPVNIGKEKADFFNLVQGNEGAKSRTSRGQEIRNFAEQNQNSPQRGEVNPLRKAMNDLALTKYGQDAGSKNIIEPTAETLRADGIHEVSPDESQGDFLRSQDQYAGNKADLSRSGTPRQDFVAAGFMPNEGNLSGKLDRDENGFYSDSASPDLSEISTADRQKAFKDDMMAQRAYFQQKMKEGGWSELSDVPSETLAQWSKQWRDEHPRIDENGRVLFMPSVKSEFDIPSKEINNEAASKIDDELFQNAITPSLSRAASEDRLGDAIEHLRGSQGSSQEAQGNGNRAPENYQGQNKARAEKAALRDWAASNGLLIHSLPDRFDPSGPDNLGGGEHDVWFDAAANRWIKSTNRQGEIMGAHPVVTEDGDWRIDDASPLQYLQRIKNWNDLIGDDVRLHAVLDDGNSLKVITSQPNIKGDPVSENEIEKAMQASDFMKMGHDVYYRKRDNQAIFDLKPENAVKKEGFLLPFDGIPVHPDADMIDALKESRFNEVLAKSKSTDSLNYEDSGLSVKFMPREASGYQWVQPERAKYDDSMVKADIDKMNRSWSKEDGFYIKPGTDPQRRIAGFTEWLKSNPGTPIETPEVTIDKDGDVSFVNGRHRFSYFRDNGAKSIWVSVEKPDAARFKKLYGSR